MKVGQDSSWSLPTVIFIGLKQILLVEIILPVRLEHSNSFSSCTVQWGEIWQGF